MAPYEVRFASAQEIINGHPRMMAAHLESELNTTFTYDTVRGLLKSFPHTEFMFICGMDNALIFHRWDRWRELAAMIPIVFIARPPAGMLIRNCPVRMLGHTNIHFLQTTKMMDISSTQIRNSSQNKKIA